MNMKFGGISALFLCPFYNIIIVGGLNGSLNLLKHKSETFNQDFQNYSHKNEIEIGLVNQQSNELLN